MARPAAILQATACPECALPAEVTDRHVLESTDGPVEHARVQCVGGHVFNLPVAMLAGAPAAPADRGARVVHPVSSAAKSSRPPS